MAHEPTDPAVAIREGMDVVEAVMAGRNREDPRPLTHLAQAVALAKVRHELRNPSARRWNVTSDDIVLFWSRAPFTGHHEKGAAVCVDPQHRLGGIPIELAVQLPKELRSRRLTELPQCTPAIDLPLDAHVGRGLELKISSLLVAREVTGERAYDVSRACVVPFDEVAVVGVHDADETRKRGGRRWMEAGPELGGRCSELCDDVVEFPRYLVNERRLDPEDRLRFDCCDGSIGRSCRHRRE